MRVCVSRERVLNRHVSSAEGGLLTHLISVSWQPEAVGGYATKAPLLLTITISGVPLRIYQVQGSVTSLGMPVFSRSLSVSLTITLALLGLVYRLVLLALENTKVEAFWLSLVERGTATVAFALLQENTPIRGFPVSGRWGLDPISLPSCTSSTHKSKQSARLWGCKKNKAFYSG